MPLVRNGSKMKIYFLTQNQELEIGLKLAGCDGLLVDKNNVDKSIDEVLKNEDIGILVISKYLYDAVKEKVDNIRLNKKLPLITII